MSGSMRDRLCVVTGASSGVGKAVASEILRRDGRVIGLARRFDDHETTNTAGDLPGNHEQSQRRCDVTDGADVTRSIGGLERLDVLVVCAGNGVFGPLSHAAPDDLRAMLEVHVVGTFRCMQAALAPMTRAGGGHIVVIGSTATRYSFPGTSAYTAAKAGQEALVRVLAEELRARSIRTTRVILGAVDTPIWDSRPGFDRSQMLAPADAAASIVDLLGREHVAAEEILLRPVAGNL